MEMKLFNESIITEKILLDTSVEQGIDQSVTLPEYCADISRILKCHVVSGVSSTNVSGDRLVISGTSDIRLFYVDDNCANLQCYHQQVPFERAVTLSDPNCTMPFVTTSVKQEFCNCNAINQRRVDIHAAFSIKIKVSCQDVEQVLCDCQGCSTQIKKCDTDVLNRIAAVGRFFPVNETFETGQSNPPIKNIINCDASCCVKEIKVIPNKILVKGEIKAKILYCPDEKNSEPQYIESSFPTSHIIDVEGVLPEHLCNAKIKLGCVDFMPKNDVNGEFRMVEMSAKAFVEVVVYEKKEICLITDAYSTSDNLVCDSKHADIPSLLGKVDDTFMNRAVLEFPQLDITKIFDVFATSCTCNYKKSGSKVVLYGSVAVSLLYLSGDSSAGYIERSIDFEYDTNIETESESITCEPTVLPLNVDFSIRLSTAVEVRVEQHVNAIVADVSKRNVLVSINVDEEHPKKAPSDALTIYFASKGETVWDIARKFNSTKEAVFAENDLSDDVIKNNAVLIIPGV